MLSLTAPPVVEATAAEAAVLVLEEEDRPMIPVPVVPNSSSRRSSN
jgi:hypothetical protein